MGCILGEVYQKFILGEVDQNSVRESSLLRRAAPTDLELWADVSYEHPANDVVLFPQGLERAIAKFTHKLLHNS